MAIFENLEDRYSNMKGSEGGFDRREFRGLRKQARRGTLSGRERARYDYLKSIREDRNKRAAAIAAAAALAATGVGAAGGGAGLKAGLGAIKTGIKKGVGKVAEKFGKDKLKKMAGSLALKQMIRAGRKLASDPANQAPTHVDPDTMGPFQPGMEPGPETMGPSTADYPAITASPVDFSLGNMVGDFDTADPSFYDSVFGDTGAPGLGIIDEIEALDLVPSDVPKYAGPGFENRDSVNKLLGALGGFGGSPDAIDSLPDLQGIQEIPLEEEVFPSDFGDYDSGPTISMPEGPVRDTLGPRADVEPTYFYDQPAAASPISMQQVTPGMLQTPRPQMTVQPQQLPPAVPSTSPFLTDVNEEYDEVVRERDEREAFDPSVATFDEILTKEMPVPYGEANTYQELYDLALEGQAGGDPAKAQQIVQQRYNMLEGTMLGEAEVSEDVVGQALEVWKRRNPRATEQEIAAERARLEELRDKNAATVRRGLDMEEARDRVIDRYTQQGITQDEYNPFEFAVGGKIDAVRNYMKKKYS